MGRSVYIKAWKVGGGACGWRRDNYGGGVERSLGLVVLGRCVVMGEVGVVWKRGRGF